MFFLIDFSYKQGLGIYTRLLPSVIYMPAGIQKFEIAAVLKYFRNAEVWVPTCAGMTAEVSAKLLLPFSDDYLPCSYYSFSAVGRILKSDIFQQRFFGNDRRTKCFLSDTSIRPTF